MKNLDCNQLKIEIIGEEKLYTFFKSKKKNLQFGEVTWRNHGI